MLNLVIVGALISGAVAVPSVDSSSTTYLSEIVEDEERVSVVDDALRSDHTDGLSMVQLRAQKATTSSRSAKEASAASHKIPAAAVAVADPSLAAQLKAVRDHLRKLGKHSGNSVYVLVVVAVAVLSYMCLAVFIVRLPAGVLGKSGEAEAPRLLPQLPAEQLLLQRSAKDSYSRPAAAAAVRALSPSQSCAKAHSASNEPRTPCTAPSTASPVHPAKAIVEQAAAPATDVQRERSSSALCPDFMLPCTQRLLISAVASDSRMRGPFDVYWSEDKMVDGPRFRLYVCDAAGHADRLELCEVKPGSKSIGWLFGSSSGSLPPCASIGPGRPKSSTYLVSNDQANASTRGLSYRRVKDLSAKVTGAGGIVPWNSVVAGVEEGDGWLKVGERFLPMSVNGVPVVFSTASQVSSNLSISDAEGKTRAILQPEGEGHYHVRQGGQVTMVLSTTGVASRLETRSAQGALLAAVPYQKRTAMGQELMELNLDERTDPVLVLLCSVALLRGLVML